MGRIRTIESVLCTVAGFSRHAGALQWLHNQLSHRFSSVALASESFAFSETDYYNATMGPNLQKQFFAVEPLIDPGELAALKLQTNEWEAEYAGTHNHAEPRPLNIDPGYITPAKLVLASTKDHAHRIYLRSGIYAETTLQYRHGQWHPLPWTFPDYQRAEYHEFFSTCRAFLQQQLKSSSMAS